MNKAIDNNLLTKAFGVYEEKLSTQYSEVTGFEPSEKFNKNMQKLIKSQTNVYYKATLTKTRRIMIAAALIVTIMAASLTSGREVNVIEYDASASDYQGFIENVFKPSYIPDGYTLTDEQKEEFSSLLSYTKGDDFLTIEQFTKNAYKSASDAEYKTEAKENYEGIDFIIKTDEDMTMLIWERDGYVFEAVGYVGCDEMLKIAASVKQG